MSDSDTVENGPTAMAIQVHVAPVDGAELIIVGFTSPAFSQAVFLPGHDVEEARVMGEMLRDGIVNAAREIQRRRAGIVIAAEIPDGVKNAQKRRRR